MAGRSIVVNVTQTLGQDLAAFDRKLKAGLMAGLRQEGEKAMTEAKQETPVDTGVLRASGIVDGPHNDGGSVWLELGFGGAASSYALIVHERTDVHHPVGKAKYLEDPAMRMADRLPGTLVRIIGGQL